MSSILYGLSATLDQHYPAMSNVSPGSRDATSPLNALETRDLTLPKRLWSWLARQATLQDCSIDEVIARLIDTHRHPEQETMQASGQDRSSSPKAATRETDSADADENATGETAADRLRKLKERLNDLHSDNGTPTSTGDGSRERDAGTLSADDLDTEALMNHAMRALNKQKNRPNGASKAGNETSKASPEAPHGSRSRNDGASMFDVVRDEETR